MNKPCVMAGASWGLGLMGEPERLSHPGFSSWACVRTVNTERERLGPPLAVCPGQVPPSSWASISSSVHEAQGSSHPMRTEPPFCASLGGIVANETKRSPQGTPGSLESREGRQPQNCFQAHRYFNNNNRDNNHTDENTVSGLVLKTISCGPLSPTGDGAC